MDVERIEVPGPEQVGDANVYLLRGDENILIDTGPGREETFQALKTGLQDLGLKLEDLDKILITHPHSDHFGNAAKTKEISGAEVAIHEEATDIVENYGEYIDEQNRRFREYFRRNGVPDEENRDLMKLSTPEMGDESVGIDRELEDGDRIGPDGCIDVLYTPGHTLGAVAYIFEDYAFVGDTVLADITPNPMLYIDEDGDPSSSLENYLESLKRIREKDLEKLLPGHGSRIDEPVSRIDEIIEHHMERKEKVLEILEEDRTAFEVMEELFPGLGREKYFFGMSEAVGHLELLVSEGEVEKVEEDGLVKYCRA